MIPWDRKRNFKMFIEFKNIPFIFFLYIRTLNMCQGVKTKSYRFTFKTAGYFSTPRIISIIYKYPTLAEVF